jgi:neutral ceramidase
MTFRLLILAGVLGFAAAAQTAPRLLAGAYAADITPREWPVRLIGQFELRLAEKARDPLAARALVLDDGRTQVAIVVVDSCYVPRRLFDQAKHRAMQATGIPASHLLMSATHTHSAPPSRPDRSRPAELAYERLLVEQMAAAVVEAHKRLEPAEIGWAVRREPDELNNRRWWMKPGTIPPDPFGQTSDKVQMNPPRASENLVKPAGPVDPDFTVVGVRAVGGRPLALLGNYSLHYVGGTPEGEVSADYFGEFARQVGERLQGGPEFVGMLSNGTSGDVNNINFRRQEPRMEPMRKIGIVAGKMAGHAEAAWREMPWKTSVRLGAEERELPLRYRKPTPEMVEQAKRFLAEPDESKLPRRAKPYAQRVLALRERPEFADVKLQTLRVGDLGIAAIPCEVFTEIGLEIKAKSPFATTFTIELANGHYGYLPTPEQHELGGYETWMGTNLLEKEASRKMAAALAEMFGRLRD